MLNISFFTFNAFQENTYIITNEKKQCWIVDPGNYGERETAQLIAFIEEKHLTPQAIINTHTHIDHIFGVPGLVEKYNIPFGVDKLELPVLRMAGPSAAMYGFDFPADLKPGFFIKEGELLKLGTETIEILHTPGHSPGSVSFYYPTGKWVISGDVLFAGSIGRTDLPGGNFDTLIASIRAKLFTLPDDTTVLPGHGPSTKISEEKRHNPFLQ